MGARKPSGAEIAVIGVAGRFPGARDVEEFWQNLLDGRESITFFTDDELRAAGVSEEELADPDYVKASPTLSGVDLFDAELFRISPREARFLDPQQRLFLECAWEVLERAGHDPARSDLRIGVFAGASVSTYMLRNLAGHPGTWGVDRTPMMFGNTGDFMPTRVSYKLDLKGPSVNVQTACSTSLAAVHMACQNLLAGESDMVIAGGATILVPQTAGYLWQRESILSPDGHCRAFDAGGQGTLFGSGVGVVLLKRLEDALRDRDPIQAVVLGGAMNNDGAGKMGYFAPSMVGQREVIAEALSMAGVTPDTIGYVEAHGTATVIGDPIEIAALSQAFGAAPRLERCPIGSVKSNMGHLDIAAGIAGFIKTVLILQHGRIPPNLHFKRANPALSLHQTPFFVNTALRDWPAGAEPRRAGVSSFGIGGTNVHVVIEEPPAAVAHPRTGPELLVLSAKGSAALDEATARLRAHLESHRDLVLADVAYTLSVGRQQLEDRRFVVAAGVEEAIEALRSGDPQRLRTRRAGDASPRLVFAFPGQGSQYPDMGLALHRREEAFRNDVRRCCELFEQATGRKLLPLLYPEVDAAAAAGAALEQAEVVQLALFTIEYAMARQLERWGLRPAAVVGHSVGEYAAACVAGVFSLEDAIAAVALRSRLMAETAPGAMLAVPLDEGAARAIVGDSVDVAAMNAPSLVVLSGRTEAISAAESALVGRGVAVQRLRVTRANHSATMDPVVDPFRRGLSKIALAAPRIPLMSTVTASFLDPSTATDPSYWATQLRKPVRFGDAVRALQDQRDTILVEVGPGGTLSSLARKQGASAIAMLPARAGVEEAHAPLPAVGELWTAGADLDWDALSDGLRRRVVLPTYPFQRKRYWVDPPAHRPRASADPRRPGDADPAEEAPQEHGALGDPPADHAAPRTELEIGLCAIWQGLLGVPRIGLDDDFYALGGDSLIGTQVVSRIRAELRIDVSVRDLLEAPTVGALSRVIEQRARAEGAPLERRAPGAPVRLSSAQERLWFLEQLDPGTAAYNISSALRLVGELDVGALGAALREIVRRHEVLRTTFGADAAGAPLAVIHDAMPFTLATRRLTGSREDQEREIDEVGRREASAPFDLTRGPLLRALLLELGEREHVLLCTMHHIVSDGWSIGVLVREVTSLYLSFSAGQPPSLAELPIQVADFAAWQRSQLSGAELERQLDHWTKELAGAPLVLDLPTDRPRPRVQTFAGAHHARLLSRSATDAIQALSRKLGATPFMVLLAAQAVLLSRYSGQRDLVIGAPIANRTRVELEGLIGMFVNTLALRVDLSGDPTFAELVAQVKARTLAAYAHQDLPFERLVEALEVDRDLSRSPVFQTMFTLLNTPQEDIEVSGLRVSPLAVESGTSQLDLSLDVVPTHGGYRLQWEYNTDLFDHDTVERMAEHFQVLLDGIVASPDAPVWKLPLMSEAERRRVLLDENATAAGYPAAQTIHGLFEEQARRTPDAAAVEDRGSVLSYAALDARANALAQHLVALGAGPSSIVAVCMHRSLDMIVTLLAVLKAGAAYVPIDPTYPRERIATMLEDSGARIVASVDAGAADGLTVVRPADLSGRASPDRAAPPSRASDAAYVIYTSGSTGRPKGVVVEHRSAVNYLLAFGRRTELGARDRVLQFASSSFDVSVEEIFGTLAHGATLVLRTGSMLESVEAFLAAAAELRLSVLDLPTAYWSELTAGLARGAKIPASVRLVTVGGERARRDILSQWLAAVPRSVRLLNLYGPTEATIAATCAELTELPPGEIPIGRPVANTLAYVLDPRGQPAPMGVPGELYLGGDCLARGYLNRPALTAERFVPNPFGGGRLYRTGDRVRRRADGALEFIGRTDDQVKVRGFRIELGEVEAALASSPSVREVAVVARGEGSDARLCAYVIPSAGAPGGDLREQLRARLPDYMIPSITMVDSLPRSASGKVDRQALLARGGEAAAPTYVAPRTEAEVALCRIWQEVLGLDRVGVEDDFFALGGSSLLVLRLSALTRERLGLELSVSSIMGRPTIAALAEGDLGSSHLIPLGAGSGASREAVVFVHSLSGEVFPYLELARCLPDHATYGIRSPIDDEPEPIRTVAELAAIHAGSLAALGRPIHLIGWSAGGVIAHEIARQLDSLGCPARTLTLLDPPAPGREEASIPDHIAAMLSLLGDRPLPRVAEGEEDAALVVSEALACEVTTARLLLATQMKHHRLVATHEPASIGTPTLVLSCGERDDPGRWIDLAPVRAAHTGGDHYTMLRGVNARAIAAELQRHLSGQEAASWDECK